MKNIISVVAGTLSSFLVITIVQAISHKMYPLPEGMNISDMDDEMKKILVEMMPMGAFFMILLAYLLGALTGGIISSVISQKITQALIVGGILLIAGIANLIMIPHPLWFAIATLLIYVPFAYAGGKIGVFIKRQN